MPPKLYGAYIDTQWDPRFAPQFGAELNFRVGVYSDYGTLTDDSIRFTGTGVGVLQVTPSMAVKLGATYLDRLQIKILPAIGLLWTPNPQTKFDIYFPVPKLAHYWKTFGNTDVWWYLGAEYGGGDWTMQRLVVDGGIPHLVVTRVDYNDIRVFGGLEWFGLNDRHGFFEIGYVFNRELIWELGDPTELDLQETYMLRAGLRF
jgi:hypothetical protein